MRCLARTTAQPFLELVEFHLHGLVVVEPGLRVHDERVTSGTAVGKAVVLGLAITGIFLKEVKVVDDVAPLAADAAKLEIDLTCPTDRNRHLTVICGVTRDQ